MRYGIISAALCILISVAAWSWRDSDEFLAPMGIRVDDVHYRSGHDGLSVVGVLDADVARLLRMWPVDRRDIWSAGDVVEESQATSVNPLEDGGLEASVPRNQEEAVDGRFTAYLTFYACVGDSTGAYCPETSRTATGTIPRPGVAACDPRRLGQVLNVGGVILRCEDTGSAIHGNRIDRWFYYAEDGWAWLREVGTTAVVEVIE